MTQYVMSPLTFGKEFLRAHPKVAKLEFTGVRFIATPMNGEALPEYLESTKYPIYYVKPEQAN
ncbi:MAG: hypothetical protein NT120_00730 [Candidatus Aenigmarchaeota archaeon]|nr:hypothetical protein [Candidatus Aenigmarchaeota archaeon]